MKQSRFTHEQIIGFLKQAEAGKFRELVAKNNTLAYFNFGRLILWASYYSFVDDIYIQRLRLK
jgi:hypothetical protein